MHLRLFNPMRVVLGFQGKVHAETPKGLMALPPSAVRCESDGKGGRVVVSLARWFVAKNGLWHLCHRN